VSGTESWLLQLLPQRGRLALDVGANEGAYTVLLADRFAEVHAFDPNPQITPTLRRQANGHGNIRLFELAVYRQPAALTISLYPTSEHATAYPADEVIGRGEPADRIQVPATSLDLLGYPDPTMHVDLIKVDTEGGEYDVLAGARETISTHRPQLLIEIHNLGNLAACRELLDGYQLEHIPHPHPGVHAGHCWLNGLPSDRPHP
jgi:FkbM family methyltransferase